MAPALLAPTELWKCGTALQVFDARALLEGTEQRICHAFLFPGHRNDEEGVAVKQESKEQDANREDTNREEAGSKEMGNGDRK